MIGQPLRDLRECLLEMRAEVHRLEMYCVYDEHVRANANEINGMINALEQLVAKVREEYAEILYVDVNNPRTPREQLIHDYDNFTFQYSTLRDDRNWWREEGYMGVGMLVDMVTKYTKEVASPDALVEGIHEATLRIAIYPRSKAKGFVPKSSREVQNALDKDDVG